jgi:chemotaxis signal transduction protein/CheY-like chemotaxis protein
MSIPKEITILLVEDAVTMRKIEINTLRSIGFTNIIEAGDGKIATEILQAQGSVDLVISDWNMPHMGGYELLVWMRQQEQFKDTPFLMATGQSDRSQAKSAMEAGANGLIAKPFGAAELLAKMEEAMGVKKASVQEENVGPQVGASGKVRLRMAHIQITDHLILGVVKNWIDRGEVVPKHFELETECLPGWNPVQQALESGTVDGAFILAPIAMDLFNYGTPIKMVLFAHRSGSICVRSHQGEYTEPYQNFFRKRSFLIPHKMSVHHMLAHMFFEGIGLKSSLEKGADIDVNLEVVAPVNMPDFIKDNADVCGFMVAEPIGTKSIAAGIADLQFLSNELWDHHPCCVVTIRDDFAEQHRDAVYELTELLVKAGKFVEKRPDTAAEIAVAFLDPEKKLGLKVPVLKNVLKEPQGIKTGDLFPSKEDLDKMQRYMHNSMKIGALIDLDRFVDLQYAEAACAGMARVASSFLHSSAGINKILKPKSEEAGATKTMLAREGRYLTFMLNKQEFGVNILKVKEIIKMMDFVKVHQAPSYAKGVINLRERVIPIIDLRSKLGMPEVQYDDRSCIVIVESDFHQDSKQIGVVVDSVSEVMTFKAVEIEEPPNFGASINTSYILGMAKAGPKVKILLDIDQALH